MELLFLRINKVKVKVVNEMAIMFTENVSMFVERCLL